MNKVILKLVLLIMSSFLIFNITVAQTPLSPFVTPPAGGVNPTWSGTLGTNLVTGTVTKPSSGCYAYGLQYGDGHNGFNVISSASTCNSTTTYGAANMWTYSSGDATNTVVFTMGDVGPACMLTKIPAPRLTLTITSPASGIGSVWYVNTASKYLYVPMSGSNVTFTIKETASNGTTYVNSYTMVGCVSGAYQTCSNLNFGWFSLNSSALAPSPTSPAHNSTSTTANTPISWAGSLGTWPSHYEYSLNSGSWINVGVSTSALVTLNVGANTWQVRYFDVCTNSYLYGPIYTVYYTPDSYCGDIDHGGNNWTISASTTVGGRHYNIGTFTLNPGITATVSSVCHYFYVEAMNNVVVNGTINANGAGYSGGTGGNYGGLWAEGGYTDGRGITSCWDKDNCKYLGQDGGASGAAGSGPGGGGGSLGGGRGYGSKQECGLFGDDGGMVGGGGGAGGGGGGTYGGAGGAGKVGGQGGSDDNQCGNAGCQTYIEGAGGAGGTAAAIYGSASTETIEYGSGGAGGGGGGRGSFFYSHVAPHTGYSAGESGGPGGGAVKLIATQNLTITASGYIYANGTNGGNGGEGGENDYSADCCGDMSGGCDEQTYTAPGGGGSGAGGGSGGGIMLKADCALTMNGTLQANGGNGGTGGNGGYSDWSTAYYGGKGSGGAGGGGGRIKIFNNPCQSTIAGSVSVSGGNGGSVAALGRTGTGFAGNNGSGGTYTINMSSTVSSLTAGSVGTAQTICTGGDPAAFTNSVSASGGNCSGFAYQWMQCTSGCGSPPTNFTDIPGATANTYNPSVLTTTTTYVRKVTSGSCTAYSNTLTITVASDPNITTNPVSPASPVCAGAVLPALTVTATGGTPSLTYQWYSNTSNNTTSGTAISGATNSSYTPPAGIAGTLYYYCIVSASGLGCNSATSTTATVTVVAPDPLSPTLLANGDYIWSGSSSNDWNVPSNWLIYNGSAFSVATVLPQSTNNVVIPGGAYNTTCVSTNVATIQTASAFCKNITIESGASLTVLNSKILNVSGNWKNDGTFSAGTGTVIFNGTTAISGSSINTFHHLSISGSLTGPASTNINITGDWSNYGTFTHNSGTVTFMGTAVNQHMLAGGTTAGKLFYNLIINTPMEFDLSSDFQVNNDFTLINANQYNANAYDAIVYGNWTNTSGAYDRGDGEVTLAGSNKNIVINTQTNFHNVNITGSYSVTASGFGAWTSYLSEGGNIYIGPAGTLNANNSEIRIHGLWNNTGVFNKGTSRVLFCGNNPQEIRSGGYGFQNVDFMNYSSGNTDINVSQPMTISGYANFWDGIVYFTNTGSLTFTAGATTDGGDPAPSFVNGLVTKIGTNAFIFPVGEVVGSNAYWAPVGIAAPAASSNITAQYKFDVPHDDLGNIIENYNSWMMCNPAELHHVSGVEYWKLTSDNSEPAVTLYWKDANRSQITNLPDLCVAHYEDCDGTGPGTSIKWAYKGGDPNAVGTLGVGGSGYVTSTIPFSSYSPITFGTRTSSNPLPISLLSFNAVCKNNKVDITWSTASETNNDFFTIQRSADASSWEFVKSIPGGGNSNSILYYSTTDNDPLSGTSYYRLKQTDYNGQSEVFSPVSVICGEDKDGQSISYYPNPFTSEVVVDLHNIMYKNAMIKIYDLLGKEVYRMNLNSNESETQKLIMDLHSLSGGIYSVEFISDDFSNTSKIIKNY